MLQPHNKTGKMSDTPREIICISSQFREKNHHACKKRDVIKRDIGITKRLLAGFQSHSGPQSYNKTVVNFKIAHWKVKNSTTDCTRVVFFFCLMTGVFAAAGLLPAINQMEPPEKKKK